MAGSDERESLINPDFWLTLKELFDAALDYKVEDRREFVERSTRDPELRRELHSLLAVYDASPTFLERPALAGGLRMEADPLIGTIVEGRYRIDERIGGGGMGVVYRARHLGLDSVRALKVMSRDCWTRPGFVQRFENEARVAEGLIHPHLVRVYDTARLPDGALCIVSEYVEGETVASRLRREEGWIPGDALRIVAQIAEGLELAHARGIVHRDVAPDNLLVCERAEGWTAKLIDFGIAKDLARPDERLTGSALLGKIGYASPEQMGLLPEGTSPDGRTDVFSLATVLYEMLTGGLPWRKDSVQSYVHDLLVRSEEEVCRAIAAPLPPRWRPVFLRALARDRNLRTPSMRVFKEEIRRQTYEPARATSVGEAATSSRGAPPARRWVYAAGALLVVVTAAMAVGRPSPSASPERTALSAPNVVRPSAAPAARVETTSPPATVITAPPMRTRPTPRLPVQPAELDIGPAAPPSVPVSRPARLVLDSGTVASVILDGEPRGRTPLVLENLPPGRHVLVVTADDGRVVEEELDLPDGETVERRLRFPGYGSLSVVSPSWREVRLDGGPPLETPCRFERIPAGRHVLHVTRPGYKEQQHSVEIVEGQVHQLRLDVEKEP